MSDQQLQRDLDRYRGLSRARRAQVRQLQAQLRECRAKYARLQLLYDVDVIGRPPPPRPGIPAHVAPRPFLEAGFACTCGYRGLTPCPNHAGGRLTT